MIVKEHFAIWAILVNYQGIHTIRDYSTIKKNSRKRIKYFSVASFVMEVSGVK